MSDQPDSIGQLTQRLEDLERRVDALEHLPAANSRRPTPEIEAPPAPPEIAAGVPITAASAFALAGKAMLGIAGAYLLRAIAETGTLPKAPVAWAGIIYAFLWLAWAARPKTVSPFAPAIYSGTSALILAPMLWELTLNFKLLPAPVTAAVLGAWALVAIGLGWKQVAASVLRVSLIAVAVLSLALSIASHQMLPFIAVLLLFVAIIEFSPLRDRHPESRILVALTADAAIWVLIFIYFSPPAGHADYPQLGRSSLLLPGIALFLIAIAGITWESIVLRRQIGIFSALQMSIAFLLTAVSIADFGPAKGLVLLGVACLLLAAAGLAVVFKVTIDHRTSGVFAVWSAALLVAGCLLCFPARLTSAILGIAAVAATYLGRQKAWVSFELYSGLFLLVAAAESGLLTFLGHSVAAAHAGVPAAAACFIVLCAILTYFAGWPHAAESWLGRSLHFGVAALALATSAAIVIQALVSLAALKMIPGVHHLAFIRTLTLCAAALALVFGGGRWRHPELTHLGYAALVLVALKLVAEDLRHGHLAYIAGSIFLFAVTLIAAPRVARQNQRRDSPVATLHR